ncbi:RICIN domain-containing protein [Lacrimispora sp.]|uniref:RICIN domain-containing protein n=1 Tax=Lacrimispora sp. TaxID=2719234 RepID=UPI0028A604CC|nr:RICIN domain-containing protein [Lacrimispora sp.]
MIKLKRLTALMLCVMVMLSMIPEIPAMAANSFTVDCSSVLRDVTHCANGSLYGITESIPADVNGLVAPLKPYVMRNPARGGSQNQHPYGDAILVSKRLESIPSAKVSIDLADMLPNWPYKWPGMTSWLNQVKSFINDKKASGRDNYYGYEIWNEPGGTWNNANGSFNDMWKQTYDVIRANDSGAKIIGPCESYYNNSRMKEFLTFCKANNCVPDIMSWHELSGGPQTIAPNIKAYRSLEASMGISPLPLSINEYCDPDHNLEGQPGSSARFIAKFERYMVESACITWWFVPTPGRLGSLLATNSQKGAGWFFYKWYGDMSGKMVNVTPPNDNSNLVDGAACVDSSGKYISFIFGGPNDGTINTTFKNLPSFIGSTASVKVEKVDWVSKDTVSNGPVVLSNTNYNVVNGQISVSLSGCNASSGYRIYITPGSGTVPGNGIVSGGTYKLVNRASGKALDVNNSSTADGADVIQWGYSGGNNQKWVLTDTGNGYKIINANSGKALDVYKSSLEDGADVIQWTDKGQTNQKWNLVDLGNGYYQVVNVNSGKMLDVEKGSTADGGNVIQWTSNNGYNQQWQITAP